MTEENIMDPNAGVSNNGETSKVDVFDIDGTQLPSIEIEKALNLVKTFSAKVKEGKSNAIELSDEIHDELGFAVQRGWRDDHLSTVQPWSFFPTDKKRDLLLSFDTLREIYRRSSHVRPCIDSITKEIAHLPIKIEGPGEKAVREFIENPNISKETWPTFLQSFLTDLLTLDQAVIEKVRTLNGRIREIWVRDATQFVPIPDHSRTFVNYYEQRLTDTVGRVKKRIPHSVDDIIWISQFPRSYSFYGTPIIETIVHETAALLFSSKSIARTFIDDEIPSGMLWLERIGKTAYARAKAQFESTRGEEGKKLLNVIDNVGNAGWIPFTRPFREMQLAELNIIIQDIVLKNFGVSSMDIGSAEGLTRASADRLWKTGRSKLFKPLVNLITVKLNAELIPEIAPNTKIKFVLEPPVDAATAKELSDAGLITKNEAREALGFDRVDGGDKLAVRVGNQYLVLDENFQGTSQNNLSQPPNQQDQETVSKGEHEHPHPEGEGLHLHEGLLRPSGGHGHEDVDGSHTHVTGEEADGAHADAGDGAHKHKAEPYSETPPDDLTERFMDMDEQYKEWSREFEEEPFEVERQTFDLEGLEARFNNIWREYLGDLEIEWEQIEKDLTRRFSTEIRNPPVYKVDPMTGQPKLIKGARPLLDEKVLVDIEKRMMVHSNKHMKRAISLGRTFGKVRLGKDLLKSGDIAVISDEHLTKTSLYWREVFSRDLHEKIAKLKATTSKANLAVQRSILKETLKLFAAKRLRRAAHGLTNASADTSVLTALRGKTDVRWRLTDGCEHCDDCNSLSVGGVGGDGIYSMENLDFLPGDQRLECSGNCCCWLDHVKPKEHRGSSGVINPVDLISAAPEMFIGTRMAREIFVGTRRATTTEIDAVKEVLARYGDTRVWRLHDQSKNKIGVGVYRRIREGTNSPFAFDPNTNTIGIQEKYLKTLTNRRLNSKAADTLDIGIPHEFVHHVTLQPANRIKTDLLGKALLKAFKKGDIPLFSHAWRQTVRNSKIVTTLKASELKKLLPVNLGSEVAAMVLEKNFATRAQLIKYLKTERFVVGKITANNNLVVSSRIPTDVELHRIIDLVEDVFLGRRQVTPVRIPSRTPLKPKKPITPFSKPFEEPSLVTRTVKDTNKLLEDKAFKEAAFHDSKDSLFVTNEDVNLFRKFFPSRQEGIKKAIIKAGGTSQDFKALDKVLTRWVDDASSEGGAILKDFVDRHGFASPTIFHTKFIGSNRSLLKELVTDVAEKALKELKVKFDVTDMDSLLLIAHGHTKAILKRKFPKGKITLYRSVNKKYFDNLGISVEDALKLENTTDNSISSWTSHEGVGSSFGRYLLKTEVSIDDIFLSHEAGLFEGMPSEYILFGKPRKVKIVDIREGF